MGDSTSIIFLFNFSGQFVCSHAFRILSRHRLLVLLLLLAINWGPRLPSTGLFDRPDCVIRVPVYRVSAGSNRHISNVYRAIIDNDNYRTWLSLYGHIGEWSSWTTRPALLVGIDISHVLIDTRVFANDHRGLCYGSGRASAKVDTGAGYPDECLRTRHASRNVYGRRWRGAKRSAVTAVYRELKRDRWRMYTR